jgi:hypothetical protein
VNGARETGLPEGEKEREQRTEHYSVAIQYDDDKIVRFVVDADAFAKYPLHSKHEVVRKPERLTVDGKLITTTP